MKHAYKILLFWVTLIFVGIPVYQVHRHLSVNHVENPRDEKTLATKLKISDVARETTTPELGTTEITTETGIPVTMTAPASKAEPRMKVGNQQMTYTPPLQAGVVARGKKFNVDPQLLRKLGIPPLQFKSLTSRSVREYVFVTAASSNHFNESKACVAGIQRFFPGQVIFYFNLGLTDEEQRELQRWCNVEIRTFPFEDYPDHVRNLYTYAFKPAIIQRVLREFDGVVWMDSSFRVSHSDWDILYERLLATDGFYMPRNTGIPNFALTHPDIYQYLPADPEYHSGYTSTGGANALIIHNTDATYWNILHWWFLCSLDPECIAPTEQRLCGDWGKCVKKGVGAVCWAGCHRYDQSAINILAGNAMRDQGHIYIHPPDNNPPITIARNDFNPHEVEECS